MLQEHTQPVTLRHVSAAVQVPMGQALVCNRLLQHAKAVLLAHTIPTQGSLSVLYAIQVPTLQGLAPQHHATYAQPVPSARHQEAFLQFPVLYVRREPSALHQGVFLQPLVLCVKRVPSALHQGAPLQLLVPCVKQELTALH